MNTEIITLPLAAEIAWPVPQPVNSAAVAPSESNGPVENDKQCNEAELQHDGSRRGPSPCINGGEI